MIAGTYGVEDAEHAFMQLRGLLESLAARTGITLMFERRTESDHWHTGRTVTVHCDGVHVGFLGQISADFQAAFGIHRPVFLTVIDLEALLPALKLSHRYMPVPVFPCVRRDLAILLDERTEFKKVRDVVCGSGALVTSCDVVEVYRGEGIPAGKKSI